MNVISLNIEQSAVDTSTGEIQCSDKYSKLSTLVPSISKKLVSKVYYGIKGIYIPLREFAF